MIEVNDAAHLASLPDGTIIRWLRIPGDETSEAVAFVRQQIEPIDDPDGDSAGLPRQHRTVTWISPGGWAPMSIGEAQITYPVQVVQLPLLHASTLIESGQFDQQLEVPPGFCTAGGGYQFGDLIGGTWARERALEAASRIWAGPAFVTNELVLGSANVFEQWLDRPVEADPSSAIADVASDGWGDEGPPPADIGEVSSALYDDLMSTGYLRNQPLSDLVNKLVDRGWHKRA